MNIPLIFIVGPTGSGKSQLAFQLAKKISAEIISVDSMKVFRGLDIGTAKPSPAEQAEVPYHLLDILDPSEHFSLGEFVKRAEQSIETIRQKGKWVILEGGSALYLKGLIWGVFEGPPRNECLRKKLEAFADRYGTAVFHRRLQQIDPKQSLKIHANDRKRLIRALEVYYETGEVLSAHQQQFSQKPRFPHLMYALRWERDTLYERINQRVLQMFEQGWIAEVERLTISTFCPEAQVALGYHEIENYLQGKQSREETIALIQQQTRKFAKKQYTWFNNAFQQIRWLDAQQPLESFITQILKDCDNFFHGSD